MSKCKKSSIFFYLPIFLFTIHSQTFYLPQAEYVNVSNEGKKRKQHLYFFKTVLENNNFLLPRRLPRWLLLCNIRMVFKKISAFINKWPGEKYFGPYRFLPVFFLCGATIEFAMIHWRPNDINFYDKFKEKKARELALQRYERLKEIEKL